VALNLTTNHFTGLLNQARLSIQGVGSSSIPSLVRSYEVGENLALMCVDMPHKPSQTYLGMTLPIGYVEPGKFCFRMPFVLRIPQGTVEDCTLDRRAALPFFIHEWRVNPASAERAGPTF